MSQTLQTTNYLLSPQQAASELLKRRKARANLIAFTEYTLPGYQSADHHYKIAEKLEAVERGEISRLMIFMPPRHGKSELASKRFPAWYIGRNPDKQIIAASYNSELASDFGRQVRNIVGSQEYNNIFDTSLAGDSQAANRWHTDAGGMYVAAGVGTAITGRGAHIALIDDPFKDAQDADSQIIRERVWNWYMSTLYTRLMPGGSIILVQTRWNDDDLAGRLLKGSDKWDVLELPALKNGKALWPQWYPFKVLQQIKNNISPRYWNALYQQNPIPEEGDFFRKTDIQYYSEAPKHLTKYGASDYAVTKDGGDWTEHGIIGVDPNDDIYILDWWRGQTRSDEWIETQIDMMSKHKPVIWTGESGPIRRSIEPFLAKRMIERKTYCRMEWLPSIADKPTRARAIQSRFAMRKVYFPKTEWASDLERQILRFPEGAVDDGVDVLSLFGRVLNKTWAATVPKKIEPVNLCDTPTLEQRIKRHNKSKKKNFKSNRI